MTASQGPVPAEFFDGRSARSLPVEVRLEAGHLLIDGPDTPGERWRLDDVEAVGHFAAGEPLRLKQRSGSSSRLALPAGALSDAVIADAAHLGGHGGAHHLLRWTLIAAAILAVVGLAGYLVLALAPQSLAQVMPDGWRERMGASMEKSLTDNARQCRSEAGEQALLRMAAHTISGSDRPPDFSVRVYDMALVNAFALSGGRVVLTRGLIDKAQSAEEVAGVLAHELGHVAYRHPEAQLVRILGLQVVLSVFSGGQGAETISSLAGLLAVMSYTRDAERQADSYAQTLMERSHIDPAGLRAFFERLREAEKAGTLAKTPGLGGLSDLFSTHPGTSERIESLVPLPPGEARPVLTPGQWSALKAICKT